MKICNKTHHIYNIVAAEIWKVVYTVIVSRVLKWIFNLLNLHFNLYRFVVVIS